MFTSDQTRSLLDILTTQPVAALGTVRNGEPFVSMVPYAMLPSAGTFIIHVSSLALHTRDMNANAAVSLMVTANLPMGGLPQSLARATFQCQAQPCPAGHPHFEDARRGYLSRFPDSQAMFSFGDFSLFLLQPRYMRFVGGFAQAATVMASELAGILSQGSANTS